MGPAWGTRPKTCKVYDDNDDGNDDDDYDDGDDEL